MINFAQSMLMYNVYYAMCIILYSNNGKYEKQRNSAEQNSHAPKSYYTATIWIYTRLQATLWTAIV